MEEMSASLLGFLAQSTHRMIIDKIYACLLTSEDNYLLKTNDIISFHYSVPAKSVCNPIEQLSNLVVVDRTQCLNLETKLLVLCTNSVWWRNLVNKIISIVECNNMPYMNINKKAIFKHMIHQNSTPGSNISLNSQRGNVLAELMLVLWAAIFLWPLFLGITSIPSKKRLIFL